MDFQQLVTPNLNPVITIGGKTINDWYGLCLAYARSVYGAPAKYPSAWKAWQSTAHKHTDRDFPQGIHFPIWFSHWGTYGSPPKYDNWGHVAICHVADDGKMTIWSSPRTHKAQADVYYSIAEVEKVYKSAYVGWSEDISTVRVIQETGGNDMDAHRELEIAVMSLRQSPQSDTEQKAYEQSALQPYTWAQQNVVNVIANERDKRAFWEAWVQQAFVGPEDTDCEYAKWKADGRELYEYIQKTAPNPLADRIAELEKQLAEAGGSSEDTQKLKEMDAIIHR